jgi:hypothetical protein
VVMLRALRRREVGAARPRSLATIVSAHHSGINSLQVRYSADFLVQNSFVGEIGTLVHLISGLSEIFRSFF